MIERDKAVLAELQKNQGNLITAEEIASSLGVTVRTIYRSLARFKKTRKLRASRGCGYIYEGEK